MVNAKYNCSQQELYTGAKIAWTLYGQYQPTFQKYRAFYKPDLVNVNIAIIDVTDKMPDDKTRTAAISMERAKLTEVNDAVLFNFNLLEVYINGAFDATLVPMMKKAAGDQFYNKAVQLNWTSTLSLLSAAVPYTEDTMVELQKNENMPNNFLPDFKAVYVDFNAQYKKYIEATQVSSTVGLQKMRANNAIYTNVMDMLADAQVFFKNDPSVATKFVWVNIVSQTRGTKSAGLNGKITDLATGLVIANVEVSVVNGNKIVVTDAEGRFDLSPLASGIYSISVAKEGYNTVVVQNQEVKVGVVSRLNVVLETVTPPVAVPQLMLN